MKKLFKTIIIWIITLEARVVLLKYRPKIIAVTGSVGKTSTKDAIWTILSKTFFARKSEKSFNSEIGVPLTILGLENAWSNPFKWLKNILEGLALIIFPNHYPNWLVLEVGADRPGDIEKISRWLKPNIAVFTRLSRVPVHVEYFPTPEALFQEKAHLAKALKKTGTLILNADDSDVLSFKKLHESKVISYGLVHPADLRASNYNILYENSLGEFLPTGINFKLNKGGNSSPVSIRGGLGLQHVYPALAAISVAVACGINTITATEALSDHVTPPGRMKIISGLRGSLIIDDTYNSSPVALHEALDTLKQITATGRKIAVLGDMLELGQYSTDEHKKAGEIAAKICDLLITVGVRAKVIGESALNNGMHKKDVIQFDESRKAGKYLKELLHDGDIVLVKGSQSIRTEKVVEEIMAHPEDAENLLVRQDEEWAKR